MNPDNQTAYLLLTNETLILMWSIVLGDCFGLILKLNATDFNITKWYNKINIQSLIK